MVSVESRNTIIGKECLKKKDELEKKKKKTNLSAVAAVRSWVV